MHQLFGFYIFEFIVVLTMKITFFVMWRRLLWYKPTNVSKQLPWRLTLPNPQ